MGLKCYLKEYRKKANLTQDELANLVNVRRETIGRLESGQYNPSLELALRIADAVNAPIEEIFKLK
jgi:DNA-binding XRE family transcriptional regulator